MYIQFTKEIEENGKIPFLGCLVTYDNNKPQTTIYRKPTQRGEVHNREEGETTWKSREEGEIGAKM